MAFADSPLSQRIAAESSSSPTASSATSSAVKFELTKRKRSPQKQDYVETEERKQLPSQAEFNAVRWLLISFTLETLCVTGGGIDKTVSLFHLISFMFHYFTNQTTVFTYRKLQGQS
jgi:hypothetical protein